MNTPSIRRLVREAILPLLMAGVILFLAAPALADFETGMAAYDSGDYVTAYNEWLPIARRGDPAAQRNIGHLYRLGLGIPQDFSVAVNWYRQAAEKGLSRAQANLAIMYLRGQGVEADPKEAVRWFHRAAVRGHVISQFNLGLMYEKGLGVERDLARAMGWFHLATKANHVKSNELLTFLTAQGKTPAPVEALRQDPFGAGDGDDAGTLPNTAEEGAESGGEDTGGAERVVALAAEETGDGDEAGADQDQVAALPPPEDEEVDSGSDAVGAGLLAYQEEDYEGALSIWLPAARSGNAEAQFFVGGLYMDGSGVEEDVVRAHAWWRLAADQDHAKASEFLDLLDSIMSDEQRDQARELVGTLTESP